MTSYQAGDVVYSDLGEAVGHEQEGPRPVIILSNPLIGAKGLGLLIVVPLTKAKNERNWWTMVKIEKGDGGVKRNSFAMCHQIRAVSKMRIREHWGRVSSITHGKIKTVLANLLEL